MKNESWTEILKVFILFIGCTILFYYGMIWLQHDSKSHINKIQEPVEKSEELNGMNKDTKVNAIKVNRLEIFFEYGE